MNHENLLILLYTLGTAMGLVGIALLLELILGRWELDKKVAQKSTWDRHCDSIIKE